MSDNKKGENNPMFEKNHSDETKKIMSDTRKGKPKIEGSGSPLKFSSNRSYWY